MFELESKNPDIITMKTGKTSIDFNIAESEVDAGLAVGKIKGPGEFEIGDVTIRGVDAGEGNFFNKSCKRGGTKVGSSNGKCRRNGDRTKIDGANREEAKGKEGGRFPNFA